MPEQEPTTFEASGVAVFDNETLSFPIIVVLQCLASAKMSGHFTDLTNAFGQARKTSRKKKLATKLPSGVTHPAVGPGQVLLVETEIYGTGVTKLG